MDFKKAALYHQPNGIWSSTWAWSEGSRAFHISLPTGAGHSHFEKQKHYSWLTACQKGIMSYHSNRYCLDGWMNQQKIRERGFQSVTTTISLDKQWRHNSSWGYGNVLLPHLQPLLNSGLNASNPLTLNRRDTPGMYVGWPLFMCLKHAKLSSYIFFILRFFWYFCHGCSLCFQGLNSYTESHHSTNHPEFSVMSCLHFFQINKNLKWNSCPCSSSSATVPQLIKLLPIFILCLKFLYLFLVHVTMFMCQPIWINVKSMISWDIVLLC